MATLQAIPTYPAIGVTSGHPGHLFAFTLCVLNASKFIVSRAYRDTICSPDTRSRLHRQKTGGGSAPVQVQGFQHAGSHGYALLCLPPVQAVVRGHRRQRRHLARSTPTAPRPDVGTYVGTGLAQAAAPSAVDAVLASSRSLTAATTWSPEPAADETTSARCRVLAAPAMRGELSGNPDEFRYHHPPG